MKRLAAGALALALTACMAVLPRHPGQDHCHANRDFIEACQVPHRA